MMVTVAMTMTMNEIKVKMNDFYIWVNMPGQKLSKYLSPNGGNANWRSKARVTKEQRAQIDRLFKAALREKFGSDATAGEFLDAFGQFDRIDDGYPVSVRFIRQYTGNERPYDDDNLRPMWKAYRDGLAAALWLPDDSERYMKAEYEQIRVKALVGEIMTGLSVRISPAWYPEIKKESNQEQE